MSSKIEMSIIPDIEYFNKLLSKFYEFFNYIHEDNASCVGIELTDNIIRYTYIEFYTDINDKIIDNVDINLLLKNDIKTLTTYLNRAKELEEIKKELKI